MEQTNSLVMSMLQTMTNTAELPKTSPKAEGESSDFQKLMEKAQSGQPDGQIEERPKAKTDTTVKKTKAPAQKGDPAEDSKQLQVYLVPLTQEQLSQIPAEWLPVSLEEGEPVVCIGVRTGENGEEIPVLVGAREAAQRYGKEVVAPWRTFDVSDPEADAILETTAPGADNSPAAMLERVVDEEAGQVVKQAVKEIQPQADTADDDAQVEVTDVEQAPQRLFHDVEAAPVKVGEVYDAQPTEQPGVASQIDTQLAQALQTGESMVRIQLTPENLGEVTVEISQKADGVLHIALSAHSSETRGLLERHAADLQGLVSSRTQQEVQVSVQRQQESQQNQNQQHGYDGSSGHAQDGQREHRRQRGRASSQDFMQQLRLGLIPADGEI